VTPEDIQKWQQMADGAWADYTKIAGKSKQAKPIIEAMGGLLKHIGGGGQQQGQQGQGQAKQGQQTVPQPPQGAPTWQEIPRADMPTTGDLRNLSNPTVPPPPNPMEEQATGAANDEAMQRTAKQGELDADSKRRASEKEAEVTAASKVKQTEREAEIKAQSEARVEEETAKIKAQGTERQAEEEARHRDKMAEIDEAGKYRGSGSKAAGAKPPKESSEESAANKAADQAETDYALAQQRLENPTPVGDTGIVLSWVRSQIRGGGRINNTEIQSLLKSGKLETRFNNAYQRALNGTVDPEFRKQMVDDIGKTAGVARKQADRYKSARPSTVPPPPKSGSHDNDPLRIR
jgi:hypothetical protein